MNINPVIVDLLPPVNSHPKSIVDILPQPKNDISNILMNKFRAENNLRNMLSQLKNQSAALDSNLGYEKYVKVTPDVQKVALEITHGAKTDDEKMYRIEQWVQKNVTYTSDIKNYHQSEYWAFPSETLRNRKGDCEDGAFLIHALGLASGVDPEKLRTYGGVVYDPNSGGPGGHGWVAYERELDNEWITLDWCYWAKHSDLDSRKPMSEDLNYIDDMWYVTADKTVETPIANKVRYASGGFHKDMIKGAYVNFKA